MNNKPDFIIIGTGMGGATLGYALAQAGAKVLFLEKGLSRLNSNKVLMGSYAETFAHQQKNKDMKKVLKLGGRYFSSMYDVSGSLKQHFIPFIGSGGGGGSALFGAVMERFRMEDFSSEKWPIAYQELEPYYVKAESQYRVRNTTDNTSLNTNIPLSQANHKIWAQLTDNGYHPYHLPTATESSQNCLDNCQSYLCAKHCKNDSEKIALRPAIENHQAKLLDDCEVLDFNYDKNRISSVTCKIGEEIKQLEADHFILAAGALVTPGLLLKSNNLANSSGLVGKYLMRHFVDLYAVKVAGTKVLSETQKQVGFNDLYLTEGEKYGTVQSFGLMPPLEVVIQELKHTLPLNLGEPITWTMDKLYPIIAASYSWYFGDKVVFASIMDDLPYLENRVEYKNGQIGLHYKLNLADRKRIDQFRKKVVEAFHPFPVTVMKQATNNQRLAHACGTCRFGDDSSASVLNRFNKAHDLENLSVVDASFFPTSGGINPALTIAANALRVADAMVSGMQNKA